MATAATPNDRFNRMRQSVKRHLAMEAKKTLQIITDEFPDNPEAMNYFYDRARVFTGETRWTWDKPVIATMCIQVPMEIIMAAGAQPVRICSGAYAFDAVGAEFLPAKSCPLIKSTFGEIYLDVFPNDLDPLLIVNPTTCDQKRKVMEVTADLVNRKTYTLELPPNKESEAGRLYWERVVKEFASKVEKVTGHRITRRKLRQAIKQVAEAQREFRRLYNLRKQQPVLWGKDAILVTNTYFYDDIAQWTAAVKRLNAELEARLKAEQFLVNRRVPRILLTGSPSIFPNFKIPLLVELNGGIIVAEEYCSTTRMLYDTVAVEEWFFYNMMPAIANRYLKPCTCPNFTPNTDRERTLLRMIEEFQVDGVIYQAFAGCQLFDLESRKIGRLLEAHHIPMLHIETDYSPDDHGQLSTRIEAFIESIKTHKRIQQ